MQQFLIVQLYCLPLLSSSEESTETSAVLWLHVQQLHLLTCKNNAQICCRTFKALPASWAVFTIDILQPVQTTKVACYSNSKSDNQAIVF